MERFNAISAHSVPVTCVSRDRTLRLYFSRKYRLPLWRIIKVVVAIGYIADIGNETGLKGIVKGCLKRESVSCASISTEEIPAFPHVRYCHSGVATGKMPMAQAQLKDNVMFETQFIRPPDKSVPATGSNWNAASNTPALVQTPQPFSAHYARQRCRCRQPPLIT